MRLHGFFMSWNGRQVLCRHLILFYLPQLYLLISSRRPGKLKFLNTRYLVTLDY